MSRWLTLGVIAGLAGLSPAAWPLTDTEVSTGAAAVAVIAYKCLPERDARAYHAQAMADLREMLRHWPAYEREVVLDSAERKVRAMSISSRQAGCHELAHLRAMARQWGFSHLVP